MTLGRGPCPMEPASSKVAGKVMLVEHMRCSAELLIKLGSVTN